ncbi:MAG: outer membrane lipoprotein chaperone LolA [Pseudomonadota bacterium]
MHKMHKLKHLVRRFYLRRVLVSTLLALSFIAPAHADSVEQLQAFLATTRNARADFAQIVRSKNGRAPQASTGVMMFERPGKFRWEIKQPYPQLLVGDGAQIWIYDPELRQATVKKADAALGSTVLGLLAGSNKVRLDKNFDLRDLGEHDGFAWVEAIPKAEAQSEGSGFESIRLGFSGGQLKAMELLDHFGQTTHLLFARLERNTRLADSLFRFTPPPGTDVLSE